LGEKCFRCGDVWLDDGELDLLMKTIESGYIKPFIDREYTLSEVPEALRYVAEGNARGKVVIVL
jgi:Zn-finger nucleic acid-binding protein